MAITRLDPNVLDRLAAVQASLESRGGAPRKGRTLQPPQAVVRAMVTPIVADVMAALEDAVLAQFPYLDETLPIFHDLRLLIANHREHSLSLAPRDPQLAYTHHQAAAAPPLIEDRRYRSQLTSFDTCIGEDSLPTTEPTVYHYDLDPSLSASPALPSDKDAEAAVPRGPKYRGLNRAEQAARRAASLGVLSTQTNEDRAGAGVKAKSKPGWRVL